MPRPAKYALIWSADQGLYHLYEQGNQERLLTYAGDDAWFGWLAAHSAFSFHGQAGRANLLKERRKNQGEGYWYAYRRQGKRTAKLYVGRSAGLTAARLEAAAKALASGAAEAVEATGSPARRAS